jgi:preprotein translocase subunit SecA
LLTGTLDDVESQLQALIAGVPEAEAADIIAKKTAEFGREAFLSAVRIILLQTIDMFWVEHLEVMDYTRSSVNLRAYGQRDPLVEYKKEGLRLYREMQSAMQGQVVRILPNIVPVANGAPVASNVDMKDVQENAQGLTSGDGSQKSSDTAKAEPGRNDQCYCGSGKKYKKCHGAGK